MAQRGLDDWEIALIKRMMIDGYARDKMHAYFNRPDRTLTPAAYSEIKAGKFGAEIMPASPATLARYVESYGSSRAEAEGDPLGAAETSKLLALGADAACLVVGEGDHVEFKASFSFKEHVFAKLLRAMAALANNAGGYIICGVEDKTGRVLGLSSEDFDTDLSRWSTLIKSALMPMPLFERMRMDIGGVSIGVIFVHESANKPVCAIKKVSDHVRNGAIYYRYPAQSEEISYGELSTILRARDRQAREELLSSLEIYNKRSPDEVAVIDLQDGTVANSPERLKLSPDVISQLFLIKEGEFVEREGAPAIRLVAEAEAVPNVTSGATVVRGFVNEGAVLRNFVNDAEVVEPIQYFNAALNSTADWLPLFRWARLAGLSLAEALNCVDEESLPPRKRERAIDRLVGKRLAKQPVSKTYKDELNRILLCEHPDIQGAPKLRRVAIAMRSLPDSLNQAQLDCAKKTLKAAYDYASAPGTGGDLLSLVRSAASRIDEIENKPALA